jgi:hypothetical protein
LTATIPSFTTGVLKQSKQAAMTSLAAMKRLCVLAERARLAAVTVDREALRNPD